MRHVINLPLPTALPLHSTQPSTRRPCSRGTGPSIRFPPSPSPSLTPGYLPTCQPTIIPIHPPIHPSIPHANHPRRTPHAARTHLARGSFFPRSLAHSLARLLAPTHGLPRPACMVCILYAPARHADPCLRAVIGPKRVSYPYPYPTLILTLTLPYM
jgi:hypothetical protein